MVHYLTLKFEVDEELKVAAVHLRETGEGFGLKAGIRRLLLETEHHVLALFEFLSHWKAQLGVSQCSVKNHVDLVSC